MRTASVLGIDLERDVGHRADPHAAELDRRARAAGRAPSRRSRPDRGPCRCSAPRSPRGSSRTAGTRLPAAAGSPGRPIAGVSNAMPPASSACSDSTETLDAVGAERDVDAAGVPEPAVVAHQLVVGRGARRRRSTRLSPVVGELVAEHLADLDVAVVDRRAARHRAELLGVQLEAPPGDVGADRRRLLEAARSCAGRLAAAGSTSMKAPETSVPRPETPPAPIRGRTTQNSVPSFM